MSNQLVFARDGQLLTTSEAIATGVNVQHKNILELLRTYQADFETFGIFAFETRKLNEGRGRPETFALLNEQQATLLVTYCKNTATVRKFKIALVKAFYEARQQQQAHTVAAGRTLTYEQRKAIKKVLKHAFESRNLPNWWTGYKNIARHFKVKSTTDIPAADFPAVVKYCGGNPDEYSHLFVTEVPALPAPATQTVDIEKIRKELTAKIWIESDRITAKILQGVYEDLQKVADDVRQMAFMQDPDRNTDYIPDVPA